jgi:DNA-binding response OmpR family regulator
VRILVIEDHRDIASAIYDYFEARGHAVNVAHDGVAGLHFAVVNDYDAVVLDLGLPGINGLDVARQLRKTARKTTPIIMLTARDTIGDKLAGFGSGADDYLVKPFELAELEARLTAIRRRTIPGGERERLQVSNLEYDVPTRHVTRAGKPVRLTPIEQRLLLYLMRNSHRVVTRAELEQELWGHTPPDSDALRTHIAGLRTAIDKPFNAPLLHTLHGIGYRICDESEV